MKLISRKIKNKIFVKLISRKKTLNVKLISRKKAVCLHLPITGIFNSRRINCNSTNIIIIISSIKSTILIICTVQSCDIPCLSGPYKITFFAMIFVNKFTPFIMIVGRTTKCDGFSLFDFYRDIRRGKLIRRGFL